MNKLEIVTWELNDISLVNKSNADRIIFMDNIDQGGTTPNLEIVQKASIISKLPIRIMIRNDNKDWVYSDEEMNEFTSFINEIKQLPNIEGIVFSSLNNDQLINFEQLERIIKLKGSLKLSFSKAFDSININNIYEEIRKLNELDIDIIMSGGIHDEFSSNLEFFNKVNIDSKIKIMPSAGIKLENAKEILNKTNSSWLHVGSAARHDGKISIDKINELKKIVNS